MMLLTASSWVCDNTRWSGTGWCRSVDGAGSRASRAVEVGGRQRGRRAGEGEGRRTTSAVARRVEATTAVEVATATKRETEGMKEGQTAMKVVGEETDLGTNADRGGAGDWMAGADAAGPLGVDDVGVTGRF